LPPGFFYDINRMKFQVSNSKFQVVSAEPGWLFDKEIKRK